MNGNGAKWRALLSDCARDPRKLAPDPSLAPASEEAKALIDAEIARILSELVASETFDEIKRLGEYNE